MAISVGIIVEGNIGHIQAGILNDDEHVDIIGVTDIVIPSPPEKFY